MTKKEWQTKLRIGLRVTMTLDEKIYKGTIFRVNSNGSQALVKWDGQTNETWYGRTGIEILAS